MIKAIISDIDGTLLNSKLEYTPRLMSAIDAAQAQGTIFTLATGRMYVSAKHAVQGLPIHVPIICYNGAYIREFDSERVLSQQCLDTDAATRILSVCKKYNWHVQYYINDCLYSATDNELIRKYAKLTGVNHTVLGNEFYTPQASINKILLIEEHQDISAIRSQLEQSGARVDFTSSKSSFLEIVPQGVSKAVAIKQLGDYLGIDVADIMAVGDSFNDLEMLKSVGHSVAMGNAEPEVQAAARYITASNDEDGLAKAIEKYVLGESQ